MKLNLNENLLYTNQAEKDALLADKQRILDAFYINFFGFVGLVAINSNRGALKNYEQTEGKLFIKNIGDDNHDVSLSIKLASDAGLLKPQVVNRMTKLLVLIKSKTVTSKNFDASQVLAIAQELNINNHKPSMVIYNAVSAYLEGRSDLPHLAKQLYKIGLMKEFKPISQEYFNLVRSGQYLAYFQNMPDYSFKHPMGVSPTNQTVSTSTPAQVASQPQQVQSVQNTHVVQAQTTQTQAVSSRASKPSIDVWFYDILSKSQTDPNFKMSYDDQKQFDTYVSTQTLFKGFLNSDNLLKLVQVYQGFKSKSLLEVAATTFKTHLEAFDLLKLFSPEEQAYWAQLGEFFESIGLLDRLGHRYENYFSGQHMQALKDASTNFKTKPKIITQNKYGVSFATSLKNLLWGVNTYVMGVMAGKFTFKTNDDYQNFIGVLDENPFKFVRLTDLIKPISAERDVPATLTSEVFKTFASYDKLQQNEIDLVKTAFSGFYTRANVGNWLQSKSILDSFKDNTAKADIMNYIQQQIAEGFKTGGLRFRMELACSFVNNVESDVIDDAVKAFVLGLLTNLDKDDIKQAFDYSSVVVDTNVPARSLLQGYFDFVKTLYDKNTSLTHPVRVSQEEYDKFVAFFKLVGAKDDLIAKYLTVPVASSIDLSSLEIDKNHNFKIFEHLDDLEYLFQKHTSLAVMNALENEPAIFDYRNVDLSVVDVNRAQTLNVVVDYLSSNKFEVYVNAAIGIIEIMARHIDEDVIREFIKGGVGVFLKQSLFEKEKSSLLSKNSSSGKFYMSVSKEYLKVAYEELGTVYVNSALSYMTSNIEFNKLFLKDVLASIKNTVGFYQDNSIKIRGEWLEAFVEKNKDNPDKELILVGEGGFFDKLNRETTRFIENNAQMLSIKNPLLKYRDEPFYTKMFSFSAEAIDAISKDTSGTPWNSEPFFLYFCPTEFIPEWHRIKFMKTFEDAMNLENRYVSSWWAPDYVEKINKCLIGGHALISDDDFEKLINSQSAAELYAVTHKDKNNSMAAAKDLASYLEVLPFDRAMKMLKFYSLKGTESSLALRGAISEQLTEWFEKLDDKQRGTLFDNLDEPTLKKVIANVGKKKAVSAVRDNVSSPNNLIPVKLSEEDVKKALEINDYDFKSVTAKIKPGKIKSYNDLINQVSTIYDSAIKAAPVQRIKPVTRTQKELDLMSLEFYKKVTGRHRNSCFAVIDEFDVEQSDVKQKFEAFLKERGDNAYIVKPMYHGCGDIAASWISRTGFKIVTGSSGPVKTAGKMLGVGIYFTDVTDKAVMYCTNHGNNARLGEIGYVVEMDAILTKNGEVTYPSVGTNFKDGDWARAGKGSGSTNMQLLNRIRSTEYCVYRTEQTLPIKMYKVVVKPFSYFEDLKEKYKNDNVIPESVQRVSRRLNSYMDYLKEEKQMNNTPFISYTFKDGLIPDADDTYLEWEEWKNKYRNKKDIEVSNERFGIEIRIYGNEYKNYDSDIFAAFHKIPEATIELFNKQVKKAK